MADIRLAHADTDRSAVYAFRYNVIINELGVRLATADNARRVVIDSEDRTAHLLAAYDDGRVIGTVRMNVLADGPAEPHSSLLGLDSVEHGTLSEASVTSRLLVTASHRGGPLVS